MLNAIPMLVIINILHIQQASTIPSLISETSSAVPQDFNRDSEQLTTNLSETVPHPIGANCPEPPGTVPDLEGLCRVPPGNKHLPRLSRNSTNP